MNHIFEKKNYTMKNISENLTENYFRKITLLSLHLTTTSKLAMIHKIKPILNQNHSTKLNKSLKLYIHSNQTNVPQKISIKHKDSPLKRSPLLQVSPVVLRRSFVVSTLSLPSPFIVVALQCHRRCCW